jgi:hypothetical protein
MPEHNRESDRLSDMPGPLRWFLIFFKQVGFPTMVCCFLAYMLFIEGPKNRKNMDDFRDVISTLNRNIEIQTKILRHRNGNDE